MFSECVGQVQETKAKERYEYRTSDQNAPILRDVLVSQKVSGRTLGAFVFYGCKAIPEQVKVRSWQDVKVSAQMHAVIVLDVCFRLTEPQEDMRNRRV